MSPPKGTHRSRSTTSRWASAASSITFIGPVVTNDINGVPLPINRSSISPPMTYRAFRPSTQLAGFGAVHQFRHASRASPHATKGDYFDFSAFNKAINVLEEVASFAADLKSLGSNGGINFGNFDLSSMTDALAHANSTASPGNLRTRARLGNRGPPGYQGSDTTSRPGQQRRGRSPATARAY